jgi:hypothetical protein
VESGCGGRKPGQEGSSEQFSEIKGEPLRGPITRSFLHVDLLVLTITGDLGSYFCPIKWYSQ